MLEAGERSQLVALANRLSDLDAALRRYRTSVLVAREDLMAYAYGKAERGTIHPRLKRLDEHLALTHEAEVALGRTREGWAQP
jgi:hypothetical protein